MKLMYTFLPSLTLFRLAFELKSFLTKLSCMCVSEKIASLLKFSWWKCQLMIFWKNCHRTIAAISHCITRKVVSGHRPNVPQSTFPQQTHLLIKLLSRKRKTYYWDICTSNGIRKICQRNVNFQVTRQTQTLARSKKSIH